MIPKLLWLLSLSLPSPLPVSQVEFDRHVTCLSSRSWKAREQAHVQLYRLGWRALPWLERERDTTKDPETRARLTRICSDLHGDRFRWATETAVRRYGPHYPMVDALWLNTTTASYERHGPTPSCLWRGQMAGHYLDQHIGQDYPDDDVRRYPAFRDGTRDLFADLLERGVPVPVVDLLAVEMWRRDNLWWRRSARAQPDPFWLPGWLPQSGFPERVVSPMPRTD